MRKEFEKNIREIKRLLHRGDVKRIADKAGVSQPTVTYVLQKTKDPTRLTPLQLKAYIAAKEVATENQQTLQQAIGQ